MLQTIGQSTAQTTANSPPETTADGVVWFSFHPTKAQFNPHYNSTVLWVTPTGILTVKKWGLRRIGASVRPGIYRVGLYTLQLPMEHQKAVTLRWSITAQPTEKASRLVSPPLWSFLEGCSSSHSIWRCTCPLWDGLGWSKDEACFCHVGFMLALTYKTNL